MKPLIKWAGGKRQILPRLIDLLPEEWDRYFEPFAGGLALLVELHNRGKLGEAVISETNPELFNLYRVVKEDPVGLSETIGRLNFRNDNASYYSIRKRFNGITGADDHALERAAMFLYLNRHGFNGLWRVNSKGSFNVPFGRYSNPQIPGVDDIQDFSSVLKGVDIMNGDFQSALTGAREGDFVYLDPPYIPLSKTSSFTYYTKTGFGIEDQLRLLHSCNDLTKKGVKFLLSNSFSEKVVELFGEFNIIEIAVRRNINSNSQRRSGHQELLISNY